MSDLQDFKHMLDRQSKRQARLYKRDAIKNLPPIGYEVENRENGERWLKMYDGDRCRATMLFNKRGELLWFMGD